MLYRGGGSWKAWRSLPQCVTDSWLCTVRHSADSALDLGNGIDPQGVRQPPNILCQGRSSAAGQYQLQLLDIGVSIMASDNMTNALFGSQVAFALRGDSNLQSLDTDGKALAWRVSGP